MAAKKSSREVRVRLAPQKIEVRTAADGTRSISGYAATFGDLSQDLGNFRERIQKGAFSESLKDNPDVLCLYGHDDNQILGRVSSGTLQLEEDDKGLRFLCRLPDTSAARDLVALMERGDVSAMSFGFTTVEDDWQDVDGQLIRTLIQVQLWEISVVGQPAYTSTSVNLRSLPQEFRDKLKRGFFDSDSDTDGDADEEYRCDCDCDACLDGNCDECSNPDCDDDTCEGCPYQDDVRADRLRIRALFNSLQRHHCQQA